MKKQILSMDDIKKDLCDTKGAAMSIVIFAFGMGLGTILLLMFLFTTYMSQIEDFYNDVTLDCFSSSKSSLVQLSIENEQSDEVLTIDTAKIKTLFRENLAQTFNCQNLGTDILISNADNKFIKKIEIKDLKINDTTNGQELETLVYITARPYFFQSFFKDPVYKIRTQVLIDHIEK